LIWAKQFGGTGDDYARGIDIDASGNIYVSGVFSNSIDFDGLILTAAGSSDIFLIKMDSNGNIIWGKKIHSITSIGGVDSYISKIKSTNPLGINTITSGNRILIVYPNPANTFINVDCKKGYQIYSSTGQLVKQSSQDTTQINVSDLPTGLYILMTENQLGRFVKTE